MVSSSCFLLTLLIKGLEFVAGVLKLTVLDGLVKAEHEMGVAFVSVATSGML